MAEVRAWVASAGLTLHPDKTRIASLRQADGYIDFLGYRFEYHADKGHRCTIRPQKLTAIRAQVKALTPRTYRRATEVTESELPKAPTFP